MLQDANRDLLVLTRSAQLNPEELGKELHQLNALLYHVENWDNFCKAHELIDINRHRIVRKPHRIQHLLCSLPLKPFVFTSNRN